MTFFWLMLTALVGVSQSVEPKPPRQYLEETGNYHHVPHPQVHLEQDPSRVTSTAICRLSSSEGYNVQGDVVFRQASAEDPVEITGTISGLSPGFHGFHVHQNANLTDNCKAAGPHFNPSQSTHGAPYDAVRHAGDLGNIPADVNGISAFQMHDHQISLYDNHPHQVLGRAIVIHANEDDLGRTANEESKKTGNAGPRVACCIIEPVSRYFH